MKTSEEWLEEFKVKIKKGYEACRMDKRLCEFAHEVEKPATTLWKYDHPITADTMPEGQKMHIIVMPKPKYRTVKPLQVGFAIDLSKWDWEEASGLDSLMPRWGSIVAEREYWAIVKGVSDNAGTTIKTKQKGEFSLADLREARTWIGQNGRKYADMAVIPLQQETELLKTGKLHTPEKIPDGYVPKRDRGPYFAGMLDGAKAYWMRFMKDFALVYAKCETIIRNTPLKVYYDKPKMPSRLIIEKWCSSAPILEQAVVKVLV